MYNLIVTAREGAWNGHPYEFERRRAFEYTDDEFVENYKDLDDAVIAELRSFPTLFAYEAPVGADARLGFITTIRLRRDNVRLEYNFQEEIPPIPTLKLLELCWDLDINEWELNRTHWAVKPVNLLPVLVDAGLITKEQAATLPAYLARPRPPTGHNPFAVAPSVFSLAEGLKPEADLVSVMMPFDAAFDPVYSAIEHACSAHSLRCLRADNVWDHAVIIQDIFNLLYRSAIVVVDFTGKYPNVMYETGIAHTLGREVVPIAQSMDDVPFDLRHHRFLKYYPNGEGLADLKAALADRLKTLAKRG